jgi:K+-transporting ATPase ATPase B chain
MTASAPATSRAPELENRPPDTNDRPRRVSAGMLDPKQLWRALPEALRKLNPLTLLRNPVMFVTEVGAALTTGIAIARPSLFGWLITGWLWLTVVFANLAEAFAESRGKAQADSLRRTRQQTTAHRLVGWEPGAPTDAYFEETVPAAELRRGDIVAVPAGELIPGDGDVIEGVASVDESAITGESAPVIRESGGDRNAVTGGTRVLSDRIIVRVTQEPGDSFLDSSRVSSRSARSAPRASTSSSWPLRPPSSSPCSTSSRPCRSGHWPRECDRCCGREGSPGRAARGHHAPAAGVFTEP